MSRGDAAHVEIPRIVGLDQARAIALIAMLWAHSSDAWRERLSWPMLHGAGSMLLERFATPAFVTIFGLTLGAVRWSPGGPDASTRARARLLRRAGILLACCAVVAMPNWTRLVAEGEAAPAKYLIHSYSILEFYALAVTSLAVAGGWLRARPLWTCMAVGVLFLLLERICASWLLASTLDFALLEWLRMIFVSGQYGYLGLMGWALTMIPLGVHLSRGWRSGRRARSLWLLTSAGLLATAAGAVLGLDWGRELPRPAGLTAGGIARTLVVELGERGRPQLWFFMMFGGAAVAITGLLGLANRIAPSVSVALHPLSLLGKNTLAIYVASGLVMPGIHAVRWGLGRRDARYELLLVGLFVAFTLALLWRTQRADGRRGAARAKPVEAAGGAEPSPSILIREPTALAGELRTSS